MPGEEVIPLRFDLDEGLRQLDRLQDKIREVGARGGAAVKSGILKGSTYGGGALGGIDAALGGDVAAGFGGPAAIVQQIAAAQRRVETSLPIGTSFGARAERSAADVVIENTGGALGGAVFDALGIGRPSVRQGLFGATDRAAARGAALFGDLGAAGYRASDEERQATFDIYRAQEERRLVEETAFNRIAFSQSQLAHSLGSILDAGSFIGRFGR